MPTPDIWSLAPPIMAIILAFATRQVLASLAAGIWLGATILHGGNPVTGFAAMLRDHIAGTVGDPWHATILLVCISLGGLIGIITAGGGVHDIAERLARTARSSRGGQLVVAALGFVVFFDDYANTLLVGSSMRPLTDRLGISREKLAFLVDATAAPIASIALVSTWATFETGLLHDIFSGTGIGIGAYAGYLGSIPYRLYSIATLALVLAVAGLHRDFGPMRVAELRARHTGSAGPSPEASAAWFPSDDLRPDPSITRRWYNAAIPLAVTLGVVLVGLYVTGIEGMPPEERAMAGIHDIIGHASGGTAMLWGANAGVLTAIALLLLQRLMGLSGLTTGWLTGARSMLPAAMILVFAWGLGDVCRDLGTGSYLSGVMGDAIPAPFLPAVAFLVSCGIAFSTGTAYGTAAIMMPVAVPIAYSLAGNVPSNLLFATIGAVFTGGVFGDHCSPISDTTVMSSMAASCDHLAHVKTQAPYALLAAGAALTAGFVPAGFGVPPLLCDIAAITLTVAALRLIGKRTPLVETDTAPDAVPSPASAIPDSIQP